MLLVEPLLLRVQFTKRDMMRFLSHSEFARTLIMAARRASLPLAFAGKYRKRVKISLSPPIPIGFTSDCEIVDFFLDSYLSPMEASQRLSNSLPNGIEVVRVKLIGTGARAVGKLIDTASYRATLPSSFDSEIRLRMAIESFLSKETIEYKRIQPRRTRFVDLRKGVHSLVLEKNQDDNIEVLMVLDDGVSGTVKPLEVLDVLMSYAQVPFEPEKILVNREGLFTRRAGRLISPMEITYVGKSLIVHKDKLSRRKKIEKEERDADFKKRARP